MRSGKSFILFALLVSLLGCGNPVPPEKAAYVGEWRAENMYLVITQKGSIQYQRLKGGTTVSLNGPLKGFDGDNIQLGIGSLATTFVVSKPPHQIDDQWVMVVDDTTLIKNSN